jgi:flagellar protein FlaG
MNIGSIQDGGSPATTAALRSQAGSPQARPIHSAPEAVKAENRGEQPANQNKLGSPLSVEQAVDRLKQFVSTSNAEINFAIDSTSGVQVVKIVDRSTKDVIRQIPSEEAIGLAMALDKLQGLFVRDTA